MRLDGGANLLEQGHHGGGAAGAVESHHVRAGIGQPLAGIADSPALASDIGLVHGKRDYRDLLRALDHVERDQRFLRVRIRFADDEVDAGVDRPAHLFLEHLTHRLVRFGVRGVVNVGVADIACEQRAALDGDGLGDVERTTVDRLEILLAADHAKFLAVRVIGKRLDHVRSGVHEVAMKLLHDFGMVEHDLGHESARL